MTSATPRLERSSGDRVIAGVCGGLGATLGLDPVIVRLAFLVAVLVGGLGVAVYIVLAAGMPSDAPDAPRSGHVVPMTAGAALIVGCLLAVAGALGVLLPGGVLVPATLAGAGAALIWRRSGGELRVDVDQRWVAGGARTIGGVLLVATGVVLAVAQRGGIGPLVAATLAAGTVAAGIGLLVAPRLRRARAEAEAERHERIASEERQRVAGRLHDSVLQTLALIQREPDVERARALARRQDRELRAWLYSGEDLDAAATLAGALRAVVGDIEEAYGVTVELVQPTDVAMTQAVQALVDATREAVTNAAKHAGVDEIDVLVRVTPAEAVVFVRDRGTGFDLGEIPADRAGVRQSIRARLARVGGRVEIDTAPGRGTDIELAVPRESAP